MPDMGPLDLMARLAALVPTPRMHLTRYHGVFAPHNQHRSAVTPAQVASIAAGQLCELESYLHRNVSAVINY